MKFKIYILFVLSLIIMTSCEKDISIQMPDYTSKLTIQCALEVGVTPKLYIYKTVAYFDTVSLADVFVRDANIKISNSYETDSLVIDSTYNYLKCEYEYFYKGLLPVKPNETYNLTVIKDTLKCAASTTTNLKPVIIDSIGYTTNFNDIYGEHEGVIPYFHDNSGSTNYYRYQMERQVDTTMKYREGKIHSPCIGSGSITIIELGRSVYSNLNTSESEMRMVIEPAYSHYKGLKGIVRIQTINVESYNFFDQLDNQKLGQTNPFIEPLFLTDGQFGGKAYGYFGSIVRSDSIIFTFPE